MGPGGLCFHEPMTLRPGTLLRPAPAAIAASVVSLGLLGAWLWDDPGSSMIWMAWNLFLAWIPVGLAWAILRGARGTAPAPLLAVAAVTWLLFLPNAPYMVTDLIHLDDGYGGSDTLLLALLCAFAVTGLLLFVVAVSAVQEAVRLRLGGRSVGLVLPLCVWLSAVGIYLGRVLRWNSWDVLGDPAGMLAELAGHLSDPRSLAVAVAFTLVVGAGLHLTYAAARRAGSV